MVEARSISVPNLEPLRPVTKWACTITGSIELSARVERLDEETLATFVLDLFGILGQRRWW